MYKIQKLPCLSLQTKLTLERDLKLLLKPILRNLLLFSQSMVVIRDHLRIWAPKLTTLTFQNKKAQGDRVKTFPILAILLGFTGNVHRTFHILVLDLFLRVVCCSRFYNGSGHYRINRITSFQQVMNSFSLLWSWGNLFQSNNSVKILELNFMKKVFFFFLNFDAS